MTLSISSSNQNKEFSSFNSMDFLDDALRQGILAYGFEIPSPIQSKSIFPIYDGHDLIGQAQSGTGKTGSFSIGVLSRIDINKNELQAFIISNTHELAIQNYNVINEIGKFMHIKITLCIGGDGSVGMNIKEAIKSHIIVGTPGRIRDMCDRCSNFTDKLRILILDEADMLLTDNFKDQIYLIVKSIPETTQICLFSATFSESILALTNRFLRSPIKILIEQETLSLESIKHYYFVVGNRTAREDKNDIICDVFKSINVCSVIIFVNTITMANIVKKDMDNINMKSAIIHAKLSGEERTITLRDFRLGTIKIIIATDVLARGIDVQNVGLVVNYNIPKEPETYLHRVGRSGRYGRKGAVINLLVQNEMDILDNIQKTYNITIDELVELDVIQDMLSSCFGKK